MNVASLELCKTLFELSGWDEGVTNVWTSHGEDSFVIENVRVDLEKGWLPAYDSGFLLRKLPYKHEAGFLNISIGSNSAIASYRKNTGAYEHTYYRADTPENALCNLAIELFKQGLLK